MSARATRLSTLTHRDADWAGLRVVVTGLGVSGFAAADALLEHGAQVHVVDATTPEPESLLAQRAQILEVLGARLLLGDGVAGSLPVPAEEIDLVVTSPGWPPHQPLLAEAAAAGIPIWGDVELAWRMRPTEGAAPWLLVTGTNGKTTTVQMLASMLRAAGLRAASAGNVGTPVIELVQDPEPYDVIAVELSSFQLHWSHSLAPRAAACLNIAPDHVDWHGSLAEYTRAKGKVYERTEIACVYNEADPVTRRLVEEADVTEGCRAIGFTLGVPDLSMFGLVEDVLADRAFVQDREHQAAELASFADLVGEEATPPPHLVANALAAAALARAHGVPPVAVREGLRAWQPEPHRIAEVAADGGVRWIDDSKATNPHAARASLVAHEHVVWVAGGLLKGADVEELVETAAPRLRAAVLLGRDREQIAAALARHAPDVPVIDVATTDTGAMDLVVRHAASQAQPGDVVLLAPAAASMDMFENYGARGDAFASAVARYLQEE
ncbi:UDP-N-acetylmuramoyl-L-alanine--D-glutamate ligase [Janibacter corallicola]|uniref:UDP-N-acetylmuramoyl-L-alanine--D-glutamate ligase n=1 Tax=Janibacter corallicola TaxID=415212 RepID=UPI000B211B97|nr:UDP-N-acetylmuramoyl-L-alanine--D-glutamate ligase [Janibacter corallicola]